jgi:hypothetical protein
MRNITLALAAFVASSAIAQDIKRASDQFLTAKECDGIDKKSDDEFYIREPIKFGLPQISKITVKRSARGIDGTNAFDIIERSCFVKIRD